MVDFIAAKTEIDREDARLVYREYTEGGRGPWPVPWPA